MAGAEQLYCGSFQDSADAKMYESSLSELEPLNIELAPRVMEMENKNIELKGDASEQYIIWRKYLFDLYELKHLTSYFKIS